MHIQQQVRESVVIERTREVIEKELRSHIVTGIKELNDVTGMTVKEINVMLLPNNYGAGKRKEYFIHRIDIEYHS